MFHPVILQKAFKCWATHAHAGLEGQDGPLDDINTLPDLILFDDEGWGQSDDVTMSGLGQQAIVTETKANSPCIITWRRRNHILSNVYNYAQDNAKHSLTFLID